MGFNITVGNVKDAELTLFTFPNGETDVRLDPSVLAEFKTNSKVFIEWKFKGDEEIFQLERLLDAINQVYYENRDSIGIGNVEVMMPTLPYARSDRYEGGRSNGLRTFLNTLGAVSHMVSNRFDEHSSIKVDFASVDVHSQGAVKKAIKDSLLNVAITEKEVFPWLIEHAINTEISNAMYDDDFKPEEVMLVLPDKGAKARYEHHLENTIIDVVVGEKVRDFEPSGTDTNIQTYNLTGNWDNKKYAIILDDIVSYGGTFKRIIKELEKYDLEKIILVTSHAEDSLWRGSLLQEEALTAVFTTNTMTTHKTGGKVTVSDYKFITQGFGGF